MSAMISAGIDSGSRSIKAVLFDSQARDAIAMAIADQGPEVELRSWDVLERVLKLGQVRRERVAAVTATGYGRKAVPYADTVITEITCHSEGVRHLSPDARTVIEMGGQDSKVIHLDPNGSVRDFAMNDRCAAGCGRFLELVAARLGVELDELGELALTSVRPLPISSTCVVFAETEIVGLLAGGASRADIAAGVQAAIATRIAALAARGCDAPVLLTGGGALQAGMAAALAGELDCPIRLSPLPQYTGALGAATLAARRHARGVH
jgi:predicted CoA-substrate-specific enzyme activase